MAGWIVELICSQERFAWKSSEDSGWEQLKVIFFFLNTDPVQGINEVIGSRLL